MHDIVNQVIEQLGIEVAKLPVDFYRTFSYTKTGKNFAHPVTWGILTKILWKIRGVKYVAVDFHLNRNGIKFQPDLVALTSLEPFQPLLFVDYESPNSSDMRIPSKDIEAYMEWRKIEGALVPYIVITTLPNEPSKDWELRWTAKYQVNDKFKGLQKDVRLNPQKFWYSKYGEETIKMDHRGVYLVNISGNEVKHIAI